MYKHIMVPLDGSELAECVLPHVITIAEGRKTCRVSLVHVVPSLHFTGGVESRFSPEEKTRLIEDGKKIAVEYLKKIAGNLKGKIVNLHLEVLYGHVMDELVDYAEKNDVDLIICATHGRSGISRWVMGSNANRILHHSSCPVLMVRAKH